MHTWLCIKCHIKREKKQIQLWVNHAKDKRWISDYDVIVHYKSFSPWQY